MNGRHEDLSAGERTDVEVEFVSRRTVEAAGKRVHRLLVEDDDGTRFAVFVAPDTGLLAGLKTDARYEFGDLLGCGPVERAGEGGPHEGGSGGERDESHEGGSDRESDDGSGGGNEERSQHAHEAAGSIDPSVSDAAAALGVEDRFGVVDEQTTVERVERAADPVDDVRTDGGGYTATAGIAPPNVDALQSFIDEYDDAPAFSVEYADESGSHEHLVADLRVVERTVQRPAAAVAVKCVGLSGGPDSQRVRFDDLEFVQVADAPPELYEVPDGTPAERAAAMAELAEVAPKRVGVADALDLLETDSAAVREDVFRALDAVAADDPENCLAAVPALFDLLEEAENEADGEEVNGTAVLGVLARVGDERPGELAPQVDDIRPHLDGDEGERSANAARCVAHVAGHDPGDVVGAVPALASLVADHHRGFEHALFALNRIAGEYPAEVLPAAPRLVDALADELLASGPRLNATAALGRVTGEFPDVGVDAVEDLGVLLDADDDRLRANAAGVLGDVAKVHARELRPHVDALADLLDGDDEYALVNAACALARVASVDSAAIEHLVDEFVALLDHDHRLVRLNACWLLGHLGAEQAVPSLEGVVATDDDEQVRDRAAWALTEIEPGS